MLSDHDRRQLFVALEESLGHGPAGTLMELLPPVGWADLARQSDLVAVRGEMAEIRGEMAETRGEIRQLRGELKAEIAGVRGELKAEIAGVRGEVAELRGEVAELRGEVRAQVPRIIAANVPIMFGVAGLVLAAAKLV